MKMLGKILALVSALACGPALAQVTPGTSPLSGAKGGTGNAFMQFTGPAGSLKSYAVPNVSGTLAMLSQIQTWTGQQTFVAPILGAATATSLAVAGCTMPGGSVVCATGNFSTTTGFIGPQVFGGTATNSSLTLQSTTNGSPSGDVTNVLGSTINLKGSVVSAQTINLGGAGGGVTVNIAAAGDGLNALNVFNGVGGKQVWVPGAGSGTTPGTIQFPAGNLTLATLSGTETQTNKTLTSPTITNPTVTGSLTATGLVTFADMATAALATTAQYWSNTASLMLTTDQVWAAGLPQTLTDAATVTPNFSSGFNFTWTLGAAGRTLATPTNIKAGQTGVIQLVQDATGSRTITTWGTAWKFSGGTKPTLSTAANAIDILTYACYSTSACAATFIANVQ